MDHIDTVLTNKIRDDKKYHKSIRTSLTFGKKTLNRYYKLSDMSATYRITLSEFTDPSYSLNGSDHLLV